MKLSFVTPRYGVEVLGGAEQAARQLAEKVVAQLGWSVEAFSSCALEASTWADHFEPGTTTINGVTVHRFASKGRSADFDAVSDRVLAVPSAASRADEDEWFRAQGPVSDEQIDAIVASDADVIAFYPYLYYPTVVGLPKVAERAIMHPAAHDEPPLFLPVFQTVFGAARGLVFHTEEEQRLVNGLFPVAHQPQVVLGLGADTHAGDANDARNALALGDAPYLLYVGRVDDGKGTRTLVEFFAAYRARHPESPLRLVLAGPIVHEPPRHPDVILAGPVDEATKWGLMRGTSLFVNPSAYESFSIVLIEAWNAGVPVLVNGRCHVTREHVERSGGGLAFDSFATFEAAVEALVGRPDRQAALAQAGARYVDAFYAWPTIIERYATFLSQVL
ncbi:MAG: glycosyltransferase family 4 protein [Acidimicrobiia bacterium]